MQEQSLESWAETVVTTPQIAQTPHTWVAA